MPQKEMDSKYLLYTQDADSAVCSTGADKVCMYHESGKC